MNNIVDSIAMVICVLKTLDVSILSESRNVLMSHKLKEIHKIMLWFKKNLDKYWVETKYDQEESWHNSNSKNILFWIKYYGSKIDRLRSFKQTRLAQILQCFGYVKTNDKGSTTSKAWATPEYP